MAKGARVESIDALKAFRVALVKFAETAHVALSDAEGEIHRTLTWLETEQHTYWQSELRKRTEAVGRAKDAVRQKKMFKDSSGRTPSAVDEEKALAIAMRRLQEAEEKLVNVRRSRGKLQKELDLYKGSVQRFASAVESGIPLACAKLNNMVQSLEEYVGLGVGADGKATEGAMAGAQGPAMVRAAAGGEKALSEHAALRDKTPSAAVRLAAPAGRVPPAWTAGRLDAVQQGTFAALNMSLKAINPASRIAIAANAAGSPCIYMERLFPASETDSGWYIGPADDEGEACQLVGAADLLASRPDWRDVLALPPGCMVVMNADGVEAVLNTQDEDVWHGPGQAPEASDAQK